MILWGLKMRGANGSDMDLIVELYMYLFLFFGYDMDRILDEIEYRSDIERIQIRISVFYNSSIY